MTQTRTETAHSTAIAYLRVSSAGQADSGLGLDAQRKDVEAYAKANGLHIAAVFTDAGVSGRLGLDKRPGLLAAVSAAAEVGAKTLIVGKLCRLSRDVMNSLLIEKAANNAGMEVKSAAGEGTDQQGASAQLFKGMMRLMAAHEAALVGERTKKALAAKKERSALDGTWAVGRPPKGFTVNRDGFLCPNDDYALIVKAVALRLDGLSIRKTAAALGISNHSKVQRWTNYWAANPEELLSYADHFEAA